VLTLADKLPNPENDHQELINVDATILRVSLWTSRISLSLAPLLAIPERYANRTVMPSTSIMDRLTALRMFHVKQVYTPSENTKQ